MPDITYTERLTVVTCTCGINYAIPHRLNQQLLEDRGPRGTSVYCPLGHQWHYIGKTEAEVEREKRVAAERRERAVRDLLAAEERSHAGTKGAMTKLKRRVANGVCPHCNRSFPNLAAHMKSKHPEECRHA